MTNLPPRLEGVTDPAPDRRNGVAQLWPPWNGEFIRLSGTARLRRLHRKVENCAIFSFFPGFAFMCSSIAEISSFLGRSSSVSATSSFLPHMSSAWRD